MRKIPFNQPHFTGKELDYIQETYSRGKTSGDGSFTQRCHAFFQDHFGFQKVLLTTSCTDALELAALLTEIQPGDEVIIPSYTFPSTANAFCLRGAKIVFADSSPIHPNLDTSTVESLITDKTKAIVVVHYGGVACEMKSLLALAKAYGLYLIEDAAQAFDSYYENIPLGTIGHFGAFSFHETKNISSGEGGMIAINQSSFISRAEILREKGTNRCAFFRGEVDKYSWVDIGSSFLPSEITAAILFAQLENYQSIQQKRIDLWNRYHENLKPLSDAGHLEIPFIPFYATNNAHLFYLICKDAIERQALTEHLKSYEIQAIFHYLSLHSSPYYRSIHDGRELPHSDRYSNCLLRLPLYHNLLLDQVDLICDKIYDFYTFTRATKEPPAHLGITLSNAIQ